MDLRKIFERIFGSYNSKEIKKLELIVPKINAKEEKLQSLSDTEFREKFAEWKEILTKNPDKVDDYMIDVFAGVKNAARRLQGHKYEVRGKIQEWHMIPYDVQLIGGIVLHQGKISEMKTGEGKTLVCTLPVILNALPSKGVHVVTVNDYLAQRDAEWMKPLYEMCGLSVGVVVHGISSEERREAYKADITYGTNNEFGFDYLRDNMAQDPADIVQRELYYAIVDEVDSILIDEARTPLIISSPAEESTDKYKKYANLVPSLVENEDYNIDVKLKAVTLSEKGIAKMENFLGVKNIFTESGFDEVHHIEQSLKAQIIFERDTDYVVRDGEVIIVDEFTGRLMPGRRYSDGLHQAIEAKENVEIKRESKTLATVTFQNYFRLFQKLAGMTGTAETEAEEFAKIYALDTIVIPTNRPLARIDKSDRIFKNENGKFTALIREIKNLNEKGQPVLIGTISIEKSELLSSLLKKAGIRHEVLNAKQHEREAEIVEKAGQRGAVTIATNMAGRGTDIKLGEGVKELGGLAILGTERHESRRIDNQLRGRAGRQGDPGFTQFYVAMTDDLMRRFGGERMGALMNKLGLPDDEAIENTMISRSVQNAQKKIESFHFDSRKHVVQYDDVMNVHREKIYARRRNILFCEDISEELNLLSKKFVQDVVSSHCPTPFVGKDWDLQEIEEIINATVNQVQISRENLVNFKEQKEVQEFLEKTLISAWEKRKQLIPKEKLDACQRYIFLRSFDEHWLNHINEMTTLRDRVALSGYAQKDPVQEYKREAFLMFKKLMFNIRRTSIANLFRVEIRENFEMEKADYSDATTNDEEISNVTTASNIFQKNNSPYGNQSTDAGQSVISTKLGTQYENVGRNDLCPCGSGQKFKKCCGKKL